MARWQAEDAAPEVVRPLPCEGRPAWRPVEVAAAA
jgi:hypothetical protein